jgi:hypothetical protein
MEKRESYLQLIHSDSYKHQIDIWYKAHNISREKTELFYDFLVSLHELIEKTFLGEDVIKTEDIQRNHFTWCWNKTIENFNKEKIYFKERGNHYEYFWNFFLEAYYYMQLDGNQVRIYEYFYKLFCVHVSCPPKDIKLAPLKFLPGDSILFIEIYALSFEN